jgi:hypothetical protein
VAKSDIFGLSIFQEKIFASKKLLFFIAAVSILTSCYNCIEDEATDKYYLIEVLLDLGDGSGIFEPVESEKFIELHQDGTVTSNGEICGFGVESNSATAGSPISLIKETITVN